MTTNTRAISLTLSPIEAVVEESFLRLIDQQMSRSSFPEAAGAFRAWVSNGRSEEYRPLPYLLSRAAELTACEHFGVLLGKTWDADSYREFSSTALKAPTIREALIHLTADSNSRGGAGVMELHAGKAACLRYIIVDPTVDTSAIISDVAMAITMRMMGELCGSGWLPELVELSRRRPRDCHPYKSTFKCPIAFNSTVAAIYFDGKWLDQPPVARRFNAGQGPARPTPMAATMPERVVLQLSRGFARGGAASASEVARCFGICERTLQRELTKADSSYRSLSADVQFGVAKRLLRDTDMPVTDIALALGYADASVLTRAFTRWAGICPSDWRLASARESPHNRAALGRTQQVDTSPNRSGVNA